MSLGKVLEGEAKKSSQLTLDPFIPGGFMYHWLKYVEEMSPDMFSNNVLAVKVAGAMLLNAACKLYLVDYRMPPATIFAILIGNPRTGKGTLMSYVRDIVYDANFISTSRGGKAFIKVVGNATSEGLRDLLANKIWNKKKREWEEREPAGVVIQLWERAHSMIGNKWMAGLPEILDSLYYGDTISQRRMTDLATVVVDEGTYYFSFLWDVHPPFWGSLIDFLKGEYGFLRRVLPLRFTGKLPLFRKKRPPAEAAKHRVEAAKILASLADTGFVVDLPDMPELEEIIDALEIKEDYKSMLADYVKKLTAATIMDHLLGRVGYKLQGPDPSGLHEVFSNTTYKLFKNITCVTRIITSNFCNFVTRTVEVVTHEDVTSVTTVTRLAKTWFYMLLGNVMLTTISDAEVFEKLEKTKKFLEARGGICTKKDWWHNVLGGVKKKFADEILHTLHGLGAFKIWRKGRATYLVAPWARCCINCKHLVEDPKSKTYYCDLEKLDEVKYDLLKACNDFEPRGEEE